MTYEYSDYSLDSPTLKVFAVENARGETKLVLELTNEEGSTAIALDHAAASKLNDFIMDFLYALDINESY